MDQSKTARVTLKSNLLSASELMVALEVQSLRDCELKIEKAPQRFRNLEVSVVVALVGLAGTGLGALITGLLNIAAQRQNASIEIKGADWSVKVPAGIENTELDRIIKLAQTKNVNNIILQD